MTIWGELADLIFLWAYRLLHIFLPNSTFWPWKCIYMFCYVHLLLNINAGRCNYAKDINTTKDILCFVVYLISIFWVFKGFIWYFFSLSQPFYKFLDFPWYTCKYRQHSSREQVFLWEAHKEAQRQTCENVKERGHKPRAVLIQTQWTDDKAEKVRSFQLITIYRLPKNAEDFNWHPSGFLKEASHFIDMGN